MAYFTQLINKEGESVTYYGPLWESNRDTTLNVKVHKWATGQALTVVIRSQPSILEQRDEGLHRVEVIVVLTSSNLAAYGVIKWQSRYYMIIQNEPVYFRGTLQYYKCTCQEMVEWLGLS